MELKIVIYRGGSIHKKLKITKDNYYITRFIIEKEYKDVKQRITELKELYIEDRILTMSYRATREKLVISRNSLKTALEVLKSINLYTSDWIYNNELTSTEYLQSV